MYTNLSNTSKDKLLFKDLRLSFAAHPATGELLTYTDDDSIRQSIKRIVLGNHFEKPFFPRFGGNIIAQMFENFTVAMVAGLQFDISNAILVSEPRVSKVNSVTITESLTDANGLNVLIVCTIINRKEPLTIDFFIERVR